MINLTDLIKSAERKIADPTTTPQTVEREKALAHYLTAMQAENEIKDETLAAYRTENNELLLRLDRMEKVISEVQSENAELYVALCESGDLAREMSRKRTENVTISGNWDELLRHKWPEEKPDTLTWVLIRNKGYFGDVHNSVSWYVEDEGFYVSGFDEPFDGVTHWWNLPEVTE